MTPSNIPIIPLWFGGKRNSENEGTKYLINCSDTASYKTSFEAVCEKVRLTSKIRGLRRSNPPQNHCYFTVQVLLHVLRLERAPSIHLKGNTNQLNSLLLWWTIHYLERRKRNKYTIFRWKSSLHLCHINNRTLNRVSIQKVDHKVEGHQNLNNHGNCLHGDNKTVYKLITYIVASIEYVSLIATKI